MTFTLKLNNLITNGDFSDGSTGWTSNGATSTLTIENGRLKSTLTQLQPYVGIRQTTTLIQGHKYYFSGDIEYFRNVNFRAYIGNTFTPNESYSANINTHYSYIYALTNKLDNAFIIYDNGTSLTLTMSQFTYHDNIALIDITELINVQQYSPLYSTTFDLMSDAQIKTQLDEWVANGEFVNNTLYYPSRIAYEINRLQEAKANLKASINAKGGTLTTETLESYASAVDGIGGGTPTDGTAVANDVLSGKTAYSGNPAVKITGTMTNRGEVDTDITTKAQVVTIASGYHNGSGTVQISATEQAKIIAGNIKKGINILGVTGTERTLTALATGLSLNATDLDTSPVSYDWSTLFASWAGKTILVDWVTKTFGSASGTIKLFNETIASNSSGTKIGYVSSSSAILRSGATTTSALSTTITFNNTSWTYMDYISISLTVYEVI